MPYGNVIMYQAGDPGFGHWLRKRFKGAGRRLKGIGRVASFIPGPIGTVAGMIGDPGRGQTKHGTRHQVKRSARQVSKKRPGGGGFARGARRVGGAAVQIGSELGQALLPGLIGKAVGFVGEKVGGAISGETPSLEEASAATGLPTSHPMTRAAHRAMGGRHRRMNVTNVRALRRASSRVRGFVRTYKRVARDLGLHVVRHAARRALGHRKAR